MAEKIETGSVVEGKVVRIKPFGAIVQLEGGAQGLVHISQIANGFVQDINDHVAVGDTVKVYAKVKEGNRERTQVFEGTVIKRQNGSNRETFTVRKSSNGIGVEKTWPLHSPIVEKIEVTRRGKVRRAKLFYLRDRVGKKAKVKELVK